MLAEVEVVRRRVLARAAPHALRRARARATQPWVYLTQLGMARLDVREVEEALRHLRPEAAVLPAAGRSPSRSATPTFVLSTWFGTVPSMKYSLTVRVVYGPGSMPAVGVDRGLDDARRRLGEGRRPACPSTRPRGTPARGWRRSRGQPCRSAGRCCPSCPSRSRREGLGLGILGRGQEAHRREVDLVGRGTGLQGGRPADLAVVDGPDSTRTGSPSGRCSRPGCPA